MHTIICYILCDTLCTIYYTVYNYLLYIVYILYYINYSINVRNVQTCSNFYVYLSQNNDNCWEAKSQQIE